MGGLRPGGTSGAGVEEGGASKGRRGSSTWNRAFHQ